MQKYQVLNPDCLKTQLAMFKYEYDFQYSTDIVGVLQGMYPEVCGLFDQVETLVKLLTVVPVSSAEAERGFSGLWRLKTEHYDTSMSEHCGCVPYLQGTA